MDSADNMTARGLHRNGASRWGRAASVAAYVLLALLVASTVIEPADDFGDPSFQQALGYFVVEGLQAGEDYVFTYGPFGHFLIPRFQPGLFWVDYAVGLVTGLLAAWPVFVVLRATAFRRLDRTLVLVAFLLTPHVGPGPETAYLMTAFLMLVLIRRQAVERPVPVGVFGAGLAFLSLGKFTLLVLAVGFIGYLCAHFLLRRQLRLMAVMTTSYALALIAFWVIAGQSVANFPQFIRDSLEISRAYNAGMFLDGSEITRFLGVVALFAAMAATLPLLVYEPQRRPAAIDAVFVLVYLLILWKSGMVRQHGHEVKLFLPAMILPVLVPLWTDPGRAIVRFRNGAVGLVLVAGVLGHALALGLSPGTLLTGPVTRFAGAAYQTVVPFMKKRALEERWYELGVYDRWRKTEQLVDGQTLDIFPPEQRVVIIGGFNYWPRYVFQGYQACTPRLLALNGDSYWGTGRAAPPEFVLYRLMPIDHRFPYMEDSQALLALFYCYEPVLLERGLVLFERKEDPPKGLPEPQRLAEGMLEPGQRLDVPQTAGQWQLLSLRFEESPPGALTGLLARGTAYMMAVEYADGREAEYRVLPTMTRLPFLLNRFWGPDSEVAQNNDYLENRIVGLRLFPAEPGGPKDWQVEYTLSAISPPASADGGSAPEPVSENEGSDTSELTTP